MGKAFESIKQGLTQAIGHAMGTQAGLKMWCPSPVDVAAMRSQLGFTQAQFAMRFGVSVATLRRWERGARKPQGPALALLNLIDRDPAGVLRAWSSLFVLRDAGHLARTPSLVLACREAGAADEPAGGHG